MNVSLLLHLYQPITQEETVFRKVYSECYAPLLKFIKNKKINVTLNVPLSLLEQMDNYGYQSWINSLKELMELEKIELSGSAAYHPLLTKFPEKIIEEQIILNEYGLGFYLGKHTGFEGEACLLSKDLNGFFPPELAVNDNLVTILNNLGYRWVLVDESSGLSSGVYSYKDLDIVVICRNRTISNALSFKRDTGIADLETMIYGDKDLTVISLDAEYFGHHWSEGLLVLDKLVGFLDKQGTFIKTVSDSISDIMQKQALDSIRESSWGAGDKDMSKGLIYPMWDDNSNQIQRKQWEITNMLTTRLMDENSIKYENELPLVKLWKLDDKVSNLPQEVSSSIRRNVLYHQSINSDQFWWASKKELPTGQILYNPEMISRTLNLQIQLASSFNDETLTSLVQTKAAEIKELL